MRRLYVWQVHFAQILFERLAKIGSRVILRYWVCRWARSLRVQFPPPFVCGGFVDWDGLPDCGETVLTGAVCVGA